jgi:hypothetical protein
MPQNADQQPHPLRSAGLRRGERLFGSMALGALHGIRLHGQFGGQRGATPTTLVITPMGVCACTKELSELRPTCIWTPKLNLYFEAT